MQNLLQKKLYESRVSPKNQSLENLLIIKLQEKIQFHNKVMFWSYSLTGVFSFVSLFIYVSRLYTELGNSSVYSYFNLIVSEDLSTLMSISKEIVYALFESIPIMSITFALMFLCIAIVSFVGAVSSLQKSFLFKK